jgi:aquaporin NIP
MNAQSSSQSVGFFSSAGARRLISEAFGTFALVFAGTGAIVINDVSGGAVTHVGIAITFGLIVLAMIYSLGDVSGAHLNPAVTVGFLFARRFDARWVIPYITSQCIGAIFASLTLRMILRVSSSSNRQPELAGVVVGSVVGLEAMFAGPICGASMNPARSLGPALVSLHLSSLWIYLTATFLGAIASVFLSEFVLNHKSE